MSKFVHLHVHSQYSILDGASNIKALVNKVKELGMDSIALTDHGNMFGAKEFHNAATAVGIKPIIGCEVYVAKRGMSESTEKEDRSGDHLILLARDLRGYHNLIKLISSAWTKGFYYKPRIDKTLLAEYSEGITATSACIAGEIASNVLNGNIEAAEETLLQYKEIFGDNFYLEVQRHKTTDPLADRELLPLQQKVIEAYKKLSVKHDVKIIASNDVHFVNEEDAEAHDRLICLNTGKDFDDPDRLRYSKQEYLKSIPEMEALFADNPEFLENSVELASNVEHYSLNREPVMPDFTIPEGYTDKDDYLKFLTYKGAESRWPDMSPEIRERIDFELETIRKMGFPDYFLIVQDFLNAARDMDVAVGPGRGSAAGSAVAYCLRITDIDPIKYGLLFERFLNPDRISLPDIDIDFDEDGREDVLNYVVKKYGQERVAHIITFGTMAAKMAIRDVARVQKLPLPDADRLAKMIPERPDITIAAAYNEVPEFLKEKNSDNPLIAQTLKYAEVLEGSIRQTGVHACGIIIGKENLDEYIPLCTAKDTTLNVTQFDGGYVEEVGLLKMDFLGLKTLSIIKDAIKNIKKSKGVEIVIDDIPFDDEKTYDLFSNGETTGLFQFESAGMKRYLRELKPNRFEDLIAMNALYRPGPMEYIPTFINRKHGREPIEYAIPEMSFYLQDTYGITVYQEQVMLLSQVLAGFTKGQADSLRKAMGKKKKDIMDEMKAKFVEGCTQNGYEARKVEKIWTDWEAFAQYAFNKSHSTCYAHIAYQTGYLKANYPAEYMAAVLSRNINDIKKITLFMDETRRMGIQVLGPDVNESEVKFTVNKDGNIRFGLGAIKGVGEGAVIQIIEEREANGPFSSINDFFERVNMGSLNRKTLESMIYGGSFDSFEGVTRAKFFALDSKGVSFIENLIRYGVNARTLRDSTQASLFGGDSGFDIVKPTPPNCPEWPKLEKLQKEKEHIGIYLSSHPLDDFLLEIDTFCTATMADLQNLADYKNRDVVVAGMVIESRDAISKNGKPYGRMTVQDYSDSYTFMQFDKEFVENRKYYNPGYFLLIKGKVQERKYRENELEFKINKIHLLTSVKEELMKSLTLKIRSSEVNQEMIKELLEITRENPGDKELRFMILEPEEKIAVPLFSRAMRVGITKNLISFIEDHPAIDFKVN